MAKTYSSVEEMVRDVSEDKDAANAIQKTLSEREIVSRLFALRSARGISQQDIAENLNCSQSRVSKLENGTDCELNLGDLAKYLDAMGMEVGILIRKKGATIADEVKYHAFSIKRIMDDLAQIAGNDGEIARGVFSFIRDAAYNLERFLKGAAMKLVPAACASAPRITMEESDEIDSESCEHCGAS